jgi:folate-dependent phosphoribosylglycinamide formyltransferase PurN
MSDQKLKVIVLTHGAANRLLELLSALERVEIAGVFVEAAAEPKRSLRQKIERSVRYDGYWATVKKFTAKLAGGETAGGKDLQTLREKQNELEKFAAEMKIPLHRVENYHAPESLDLLKSAGADLGILYGTNIIKESVFGIPRLGSINLHQGLAPFYRGGPTVFWELFNDESEIGITVHFVAAKVDTGDIILQRTLPLEYDFSRYGLDYERFIDEVRLSLKEPSVRMIAEAVRLIADGREQRTKQDTTLGKRYRLPTKKEKDALLRRLKRRRAAGKSAA